MGWAMVTPDAIPNIIAICASGEHGTEVCQAIVSEMRPHSVLFATSSMTLEQIGAWIKSVSEGSRKTTASRAVNDAIGSGGLFRVYEGKKGIASVYTFKAYVHNPQCESVNESTDIGSQIGDLSTQNTIDGFTNDPQCVHTPECEDVPHPYQSISFHNHPQDGVGSSKKGKNVEIPTGQQWYEYHKERGYTVDAAEYGKLALRNFTDSDGVPIKDWKAYVDKVHRNDRVTKLDDDHIKGTVHCPDCGNPVTVTRQGDGTYMGTCTYHDPFMTVTTELENVTFHC